MALVFYETLLTRYQMRGGVVEFFSIVLFFVFWGIFGSRRSELPGEEKKRILSQLGRGT